MIEPPKLVRRADVPGFNDSLDERLQRWVGRVLARLEAEGVMPEKAELLRREVLREWRDELVPATWSAHAGPGQALFRWHDRLGELDRGEDS